MMMGPMKTEQSREGEIEIEREGNNFRHRVQARSLF